MSESDRFDPQLVGQVGVVTGGASGIGRALVDALLARGASVVVADIEADRLSELTAELGSDRALGVVCDVSDPGSVESMRDAALERFGHVDLVFNNAGVGSNGALHTLDRATWEWVLGVNLWGVIHGISAFLPHLLERGRGHIVNTASVAGLVSYPTMGPYNVSKHGVVTLSETLYHELRSVPDVNVSVLCPGFVNTDIIRSERNRPGAQRSHSGDEAARAAVATAYAASTQPAAVAEAVMSAVAERRFYVFTDEQFAEVVATRHREIAEAADPSDVGFLWERLFER